MTTVGIIAEYNPFHNGHKYHLKEALKQSSAETSLAIMSGNFTQRGEPAIFHKWKRAEAAVRNGVNLVLELPFIYACNSAEYFAKGGVKILNELGAITHIAFGSESGGLDELNFVANLLALENADYKNALKDFLAEGLSFPKARQKAVEYISDIKNGALLRDPNNILAIEYLKQLIMTESNIKPIVIKRAGDGYLEKNINSKFASAMAIRKVLIHEELQNGYKIDEVLPAETKSVFIEGQIKPVSSDFFYELVKYKLLTMDEKSIAEILSVGEGIENKLLKALRCKPKVKESSNGLDDYIEAVISKRYTKTRIQRILIHVLLNLTKETFNKIDSSGAIYSRVLGANLQGFKLINEIKEMCQNEFLLLDKNKKGVKELSHMQLKMLEFDFRASDVYNLAAGNSIYEGSDFTNQFYIEK